MKQYLKLIREIRKNGVERKDRTGTGTKSIFGYQMRFNLIDGFPLVTTKKIHLKSVIHELLWFLNGDSNINYLNENGVRIWDEWANKNGDLGPIYGKQWRSWNNEEIDQIKILIKNLKTNPNSRRHLITAWNPSVLPEESKTFSENVKNGKVALPPCHAFFQFYVVNGRLDLQLYQRSGDLALGVPFNIASYSALLMMVAQECNLEPGIFTHTIGDAHIYTNHIEGVKKMLTRDPLPLPSLTIAKKPFWELTFEDFTLENYQYHKFIKLPVAV